VTRPEVRYGDLIGLLDGRPAGGPILVTSDAGDAARRLVSAQRNGRKLPVRDVETVLRALGELDRIGARAREHAYWVMAAAQSTDWQTDPDHASYADIARWFGLTRPSQVYHSIRRWRERTLR
jgi:hypothetical protein